MALAEAEAAELAAQRAATNKSLSLLRLGCLPVSVWRAAAACAAAAAALANFSRASAAMIPEWASIC